MTLAQRRPEYKLRRHHTVGAPSCEGNGTLNEGRSINSGDTRLMQVGPIDRFCAQRRPEYKLRRHPPRGAPRPGRATSLNEGRSINSGDTPAHPRSPACAQPPALNEGRSINSGDTNHAHLWRRRRGAALNEGRSINSGDTPASPARPVRARTLNEGRSINSGDTGPTGTARSADGVTAQRRPEYKLRRHAPGRQWHVAVRARAQRRPEYKLRRHFPGLAGASMGCRRRSTKAGV